MTIGERIKKLRKELNVSQTELADAAKTTKQNIYKYENGIISNIPSDKIEIIAKCLSVSPAYLMGWEDESAQQDNIETLSSKYSNISPVKLKKFPLVGKIACGKPIFVEEDMETFVSADADIHADFCVQAQGDSMINAGIHEGDVVFIQQQEMVDDGEIAAVIIDDSATLKRVYYDRANNRLQLISENPKYMPLLYIDEELDSIRILGKAVALMRRL